MADIWALRFAKACLGATLAFWLGVPVAVQLLVILFGFDILSCLLTHRSSIQHTLKRSALTLILCGAVHITWVMAKDITGFNVGFDIGSAVITYYIFGELIEYNPQLRNGDRHPSQAHQLARKSAEYDRAGETDPRSARRNRELEKKSLRRLSGAMSNPRHPVADPKRG